MRDFDLQTPAAPGGRDLLVWIRAIALNPVDTKIRKRAGTLDGDEWRILGWDVTGIVETIGLDNTFFRPGGRVFYAGELMRPVMTSWSGRRRLVICPTGSILVYLARKLTGLTVIATASRSEMQVLVRRMGAHEVVDHSGDLAGQFRAIGFENITYIAALIASGRRRET